FQMRYLAFQVGRYERTPLHWLALNTTKKSAEILSDCNILIDFGINVNKQDEFGNTALHYAVVEAQPSLVRRLMEAGADPTIDNELEMTPLHEAARNGVDTFIETILAHAAYKDTSKLDAVDQEDRTALMLYAARSFKSTRGAELLLKAGADVNYAGDKRSQYRCKGRTALHYAAEFNIGNRAMIEFLVSKNANKDAQDWQDVTPLLLAVNECNLAGVDELLKAGASLDFADHMDRTPEVLASQKGFAAISER
ncbi:hypothetical protein PFISCL1PPCAC_10933, partial [Pristionchus fissidentatus]